jgi:hypothetical protein
MNMVDINPVFGQLHMYPPLPTYLQSLKGEGGEGRIDVDRLKCIEVE